MGYGHGIVSSNSGVRSTPIRRKKYTREFSTFYVNFESAPTSARIQWTGSGGVVAGRFTARKGHPFCFFTASDNSVVNKRFSLRTITADSVSRGSHLVTFNQS